MSLGRACAVLQRTILLAARQLDLVVRVYRSSLHGPFRMHVPKRWQRLRERSYAIGHVLQLGDIQLQSSLLALRLIEKPPLMKRCI